MMNANSLARRYDLMTPEERYCLMHAANGRGDEVEHERLMRAARRITLTMPDFAPHAQAFEELAFLILIEMLDEAARYLEMYQRADFDLGGTGTSGKAKSSNNPAQRTALKNRNAPVAEPPWQRALEIAYACGYVFRAKLEGWKLFCQEWRISPFLLWQDLPGYERIERATALSEHAAFRADGMLDWLNRRCRGHNPPLQAMTLTSSHYAADLKEIYAARIAFWGGR